jgi:septum formation protein
MPSFIEEGYFHLPPPERVMSLALDKARKVASRLDRGVVLGADTVVVAGDEYLEKPRDKEEARRMLQRLSGTCHQVFTGLALVDASTGRSVADFEETRVWMRELEKELIDAYLAAGEYKDKAGAYGIQGKAAYFIEKIEGCYFNVVGLPLSRLYLLLSRMDINPCHNWRDGDERRREVND